MKKIIFGILFVFMTSSFNQSVADTCFEWADEYASSAGTTWGLSYDEEFYVFEKYFFICLLSSGQGYGIPDY